MISRSFLIMFQNCRIILYVSPAYFVISRDNVSWCVSAAVVTERSISIPSKYESFVEVCVLLLHTHGSCFCTDDGKAPGTARRITCSLSYHNYITFM